MRDTLDTTCGVSRVVARLARGTRTGGDGAGREWAWLRRLDTLRERSHLHKRQVRSIRLDTQFDLCTVRTTVKPE